MSKELPKQIKPALERAELLRILDLPAAEFRAMRLRMTEAERAELERVWQEENAEAIEDYNRYVEKNGLPLEKYRPF